MSKLFPQDIIGLSTENHFSKFSKKSSAIYIVVILAFVVIVISFFFIKTEITVQSRGLIRSSAEPIQITSPVVAEVVQSVLKENKSVTIGDTLIWLNREKFKERIEYLEDLISENESYLDDISLMLKFKYRTLKTDLYKTTHSQYRQRLSELDLRIKIVQRSYNRALILYNKQVIPLEEKEEKEFQLENAIEEKKNFVKHSRNEWQRLLTNYKLDNRKFSSEITGLYHDIEKYIILAPGTGVIANFNGIQPGSFVSPGQPIATISPNGKIVTECLVPPKDIGYLRIGMATVYQVDAYNYNQWGLATGSITEISNEIYFMENQPFFKVRCNLNETHLSLKNGYKGKLKKGLTTTVRFKITKRTLAQLFFDKTDNWLNPKIIKE
ncbi:MAG: HlyD family efflux transporter periplasmic adaptor subunit [Draconibacterium sp.]|nr:HlyD family efflux transporter periplasmic adaptor subunit [Draconibacterium sp.]